MFSYTRQTRLDPNKQFVMLHKPAIDYLLRNTELLPLKVSEAKELLNYDEANDISVEDRIAVQAAVQKYTDTSISSTINMPSSSNIRDILNVYTLAYDAGLKGITIFRDGCKDGVLKATKPEEKAVIPYQGIILKELLDEERARRYRVSWKGSKIYITVTIDEDDQPLEVFAKLPREAGINGNGLYSEENFQEKYSLWEAVTRLTSLLLRAGMPVTEIIEQLEKSTYSIIDASSILIRILRKFVDSGLSEVDDTDIVEKGLGTKCPECSKMSYVYENGCGACKSCGYSTCG